MVCKIDLATFVVAKTEDLASFLLSKDAAVVLPGVWSLIFSLFWGGEEDTETDAMKKVFRDFDVR